MRDRMRTTKEKIGTSPKNTDLIREEPTPRKEAIFLSVRFIQLETPTLFYKGGGMGGVAEIGNVVSKRGITYFHPY